MPNSYLKAMAIVACGFATPTVAADITGIPQSAAADGLMTSGCPILSLARAIAVLRNRIAR
jgi:hypothetical protein